MSDELNKQPAGVKWLAREVAVQAWQYMGEVKTKKGVVEPISFGDWARRNLGLSYGEIVTADGSPISTELVDMLKPGSIEVAFTHGPDTLVVQDVIISFPCDKHPARKGQRSVRTSLCSYNGEPVKAIYTPRRDTVLVRDYLVSATGENLVVHDEVADAKAKAKAQKAQVKAQAAASKPAKAKKVKAVVGPAPLEQPTQEQK